MKLLVTALCLLALVCVGVQSSPEAAMASYDPSTAERLLFYSYAAYCPSDELSGWTCSWCQKTPGMKVTKFAHASVSDTLVFIGYDAHGIVVSVEGTHSLQAFIDDAKFATRPYGSVSGARVHDGFDDSWNQLSSEVPSAVASLVNSLGSVPIYVTGHSLGGAIAMLASIDLARRFNNVHVYTFGQPRVGNQAFADYYHSLGIEHYRVVNDHDIVPHLPPELIGYRHAGTEVWYPNGGRVSYRVCDGSGEDKSCSDSLWTPVSVYDHLHYFGYEETCSSNAFGRMPSDDYVLNIDPAIVRSPGAKPPQTVPLPDFAETATA